MICKVPFLSFSWAGNSRGGRTGGLVLGVDIEDAIGVEVEGHRDLGHPARCWRDAGQLKLSQQVIVASAAALALVDLDKQEENSDRCCAGKKSI